MEITLVATPACHLCEMAKDSIGAVARDYPVSVRHVDLASPEGQELSVQHRMPFPPLVLINGIYHGHGRVSEKKLRRAIEEIVEQWKARF